MFLVILGSLIADLEYSRTSYEFSGDIYNPVITTYTEKAHVEFFHFEDYFEYLVEKENGEKTKLVCLQDYYEDFLTKGDIHETCEGYHLKDQQEIPFDSWLEHQLASFPFYLLKDAASSSSDPQLIKGSMPEDGDRPLSELGLRRIFSNKIDFSESSEDGFWKWDVKGELITTNLGFPIIGSRVITKMNPITHPGLFSVQDVSVTVEGAERFDFQDSIYLNPVLEIETNYGSYLVELSFDKAPETSKNFLNLSRSGFFNGTICHRIIFDFVNQCGDPTGTGWGGPGYKFDNEIHSDLKHVPYVLSMANSGPDTNGSQWFIPIKDTERVRNLDGNYSVFGRVISGFEVVDSINSVEVNVDDNHRPFKPVIIKGVREVLPWFGSLENSGFDNSADYFLENFLVEAETQIALPVASLENISIEVERESYGNSFSISGFVILKISIEENVTKYHFSINEGGDLVMAFSLAGIHHESIGFYKEGIWNFVFEDLDRKWHIWINPKKEMYFSIKNNDNIFSWGMVRYVNE